MNFLAHLHLASIAESSLLGNLLADFVRGNPQQQYDNTISAGIQLHRRIDSLTDSLPEVLTAKRLFIPPYRRVAPITLDVVWDHFLARHWQYFSPQQSLSAFCHQVEQTINQQLALSPPEFQQLNQYLWAERWLERYAELPFIGQALAGMAQRRPKLSALADSFHDVKRCYAELEEVFWCFYPKMIEKAEQKLL